MATDEIPPPDEDDAAEAAQQDSVEVYDTGDYDAPVEPAVSGSELRGDVNEGDALEQSQEVLFDEEQED